MMKQTRDWIAGSFDDQELRAGNLDYRGVHLRDQADRDHLEDV